MRTRHLEEAVLEALHSKGFKVSQCRGFYSFDFVARKGGVLLFVKTICNLDNLKERDAQDLAALSADLSASSIVICERTNTGEICDGVIYNRYSVPAVNLQTFEFCLKERFPRVRAVRGGFSVEIDPQLLQERRKALGHSAGSLARELGLSIRVIVEYERKGRASLRNAMQLEDLLDTELTKPIEIFSSSHAKSVSMQRMPSFEQQVTEKLRSIGFSVVYTNKAPFNIVAEDEEMLIGGLNNICLEERAKLLGAISEIMEANPLFVLKRHKRSSIKGIPVIEKKQLDGLSSSEELILKFL